MGKKQRVKNKRKREEISSTSPSAPTTTKMAFQDQPTSREVTPAVITSEQGDAEFIPVVSKKQRKRTSFRPRVHPAKTVLSRKDLFRDPTALTILFRPIDKNASLHKLGFRALSQAFAALPFPPIAFRKIRDGGIALDFAAASDRTTLLSCDSLASVAVRASLPIARAQAVGTIRGEYSCAEEVHELYLAHEENPPVESIVQLGSSNVFKLTFALKVLPDKVRFFNLHRVQAYFLHPTRCFNCHRFNHVSQLCRSPAVCRNCGNKGVHHPTCELPSRCANCGGPHPANDRSCSNRIFELRVQKFRVCNNSSISEALISVASTYAEALKTTSGCSISGPRCSEFPLPAIVSDRPACEKVSSKSSTGLSPLELANTIQAVFSAIFPLQHQQDKVAKAIKTAFKSTLNIDLSI